MQDQGARTNRDRDTSDGEYDGTDYRDDRRKVDGGLDLRDGFCWHDYIPPLRNLEITTNNPTQTTKYVISASS